MKTKEDPQPAASGQPPVRWLLWVAGGAVGGAGLMLLVLVLVPALVPDAKRRPPRDDEGASTTSAATGGAGPERPGPLPAATAPSPVAPPSSLEPDPDPRALATEAGAIEKARRTLTAGDALGAVSVLNEYDEAYPNGALRQDSTALRVEALVSAGHPDTARELGERFLRDSPGSPGAARVRTVLGSIGK